MIQEAIFNAQFQIRKGLIDAEAEISYKDKVVAIVSNACDKEGKEVHIHYTTNYQDVMGGELL